MSEKTEADSKPKNITIAASVPEKDMWIVNELDEIAAKEERSRSYVALKLLGKALGLYKDETL